MNLDLSQTSRKTHLVLGVNGQDGSYLAEYLSAKENSVIGVGRQDYSRWIEPSPNFQYLKFDLTDIDGFKKMMSEIKPTFIYHLAAIHGSAGFIYEEHWREAHLVNTFLTNSILEYLRLENKGGRLFYLSSSKSLGQSTNANAASESSELESKCMYTITKNAATNLIEYYKSKHGVQAQVVWTFNHESYRRPKNFFIPIVVNILANSILDKAYCGKVANLNFWCDWGDAQEYMKILAELSEGAGFENLVFATGNPMLARDFVKNLFKIYGLDAEQHIQETNPLKGPIQKNQVADIGLLKKIIGRSPEKSIYDVCENILKENHQNAWKQIKAITGN